MRKILFVLEQLECPSCYKRIEDCLGKQSGIISVTVLPALGRIRTEYDETEINEEQLESLIYNLGYVIEAKKKLENGELRVLKRES
ncbi:MAG TPA: heavy-metal-associated domain-containing protein [Clostridiaceae bacterium]|nr:heavy-metal-associated domain-containing protein [Clostridiaceae bacterium]